MSGCVYLAMNITSLVAMEADANEGATNNVAHAHAAIAPAKLIRDAGDRQTCGHATGRRELGL